MTAVHREGGGFFEGSCAFWTATSRLLGRTIWQHVLRAGPLVEQMWRAHRELFQAKPRVAHMRSLCGGGQDGRGTKCGAALPCNCTSHNASRIGFHDGGNSQTRLVLRWGAALEDLRGLSAFRPLPLASFPYTRSATWWCSIWRLRVAALPTILDVNRQHRAFPSILRIPWNCYFANLRYLH